ncbi:putative bifunctional diguanylate cyclase/phosphodiesterase [Mesorhizobium yinganensis]|uniref:putative bifunctional diguanylate cyclase/phosphodiesterase n=1 Tax=Mesorhizobium yinganensis TaxID=3157707 RepID=UPI0032B6FE25
MIAPSRVVALGRVKILLIAAIIILALGAVYLSAAISARQNVLAKVSRYNVAWSASQGANELLRLRQRISDLVHAEGSKQEAQLRFAILKNRLELFRSGEFQPFVMEADGRRATVEALSAFIQRNETLMEDVGNPQNARAILSDITPLEGDLIGLAAEANNYGGDRVARDQGELLQLHWTFSGLAWGLVLCTFVLILLLAKQNRLLVQAHQSLHMLNAQLVKTTHDLESANQIALEANGELITQNRLFDNALHNMSQGLCMFGDDQRLIVSNRRLSSLFRLPPHFLVPGVSLENIIESLVTTGICSREVAKAVYSRHATLIARKEPGTISQELSDGRVISILHQPMDDEGWVATYDDITERHYAEQQVAHMASHDALTGLPNRVLLRERMAIELNRCDRHDRLAAVLCLDLDYFKNVNDTLGHPVGDQLLREAAHRIKTLVRKEDTVARLGGDEFVVLQTNVKRAEDVDQLARRIIEVLSEPYHLDGHQVVIGVSVGVAITTGISDDPDTLLKNADLALYGAKEEGRGTHRLFQAEMDARLQRRRMIELELRSVDFDEQFDVLYQPILNARTLRVTALEALLRWPGCRLGPIETQELISAAEDTGLIVSLGEWVLERACVAAVSWPIDLHLAVNLSARQFARSDVVEMVRRVLSKSQFPANRLELEVTETLLLEDSQRTSHALRDLRSIGVQISLDDFGTGYSSLGYLRKYIVDKIKIDRCFVESISTNHDHMAIVHAIVSLAHALGMKTTAEGIENEDQLNIVQATGCDEVQGYFFSQPKAITDLSELLGSSGQVAAAG